MQEIPIVLYVLTILKINVSSLCARLIIKSTHMSAINYNIEHFGANKILKLYALKYIRSYYIKCNIGAKSLHKIIYLMQYKNLFNIYAYI